MLLNSMLAQSFQSFRQTTWFLENNRALPKNFVWDFALLK